MTLTPLIAKHALCRSAVHLTALTAKISATTLGHSILTDKTRILVGSRADLAHIFSKLNIMYLYEVNVLELHSFQRLMNALCNSCCTEVCWLPSPILPNLCCNYYLISWQVLDGSTQQLQNSRKVQESRGIAGHISSAGAMQA